MAGLENVEEIPHQPTCRKQIDYNISIMVKVTMRIKSNGNYRKCYLKKSFRK